MNTVITHNEMSQWGFPYLHDLRPTIVAFERDKFVLSFDEKALECSEYAGKKRLTITMCVPLDEDGDSSSCVFEMKTRRFFIKYYMKAIAISLEEFVDKVNTKPGLLRIHSGNWGVTSASFRFFYGNVTYDLEITTTSVSFDWE